MASPANDTAPLVTEDTLTTTMRLLAGNASFETTPKQSQKIASFAAILPEATRVFIAFIPGDTTENMVALTKRLVDEGMVPVPHVPARNMTSTSMFERYVADLASAGADHALVIAGGLPKPEGPYHSSLQLLATGLFEQHGFTSLFVAGHPEGSPDISDAEIRAALAEKNQIAERSSFDMKIATQFSFSADTVIDWENRIIAGGNRLPVRIGLAGPASITSLMRFATMCGVKASTSFLSKSGSKALKLVGSRAPDDVLTALARHQLQHPNTIIEGVHMYPFGGFDKTAQWVGSVRRGEFQLSRDMQGFNVRG